MSQMENVSPLRQRESAPCSPSCPQFRAYRHHPDTFLRVRRLGQRSPFLLTQGKFALPGLANMKDGERVQIMPA